MTPIVLVSTLNANVLTSTIKQNNEEQTMYSAIALSLLGFSTTVIGSLHYFLKVKKNKPPKNPIILMLALAAGVLLGLGAIISGIINMHWSFVFVVLMSSFSIFLGGKFIWVFSQKDTPLGDIEVAIGDKFPQFESTTYDNEIYSTDDLKNQRVLLKFYRGAWCPYCSAELKMFNDMKPTLDRYGVKVVALSGDTAEQAKMHIERDSLDLLLLSDPELKVVKQYGVEHHKALGADSSKTKTVLGLPFPTSFEYKSMSIPTSILIDEHGVIQWIDQSEDYRLRANEERLTQALRNVFTINK